MEYRTVLKNRYHEFFRLVVSPWTFGDWSNSVTLLDWLSFGFWDVMTNPRLISRHNWVQKQFSLLFKTIQKISCYNHTIFPVRRYQNFSKQFFPTHFHQGDFEKNLENIFEGRLWSHNGYFVLIIQLFA